MKFSKSNKNAYTYMLTGEQEEWETLRHLLGYAKESGVLLSGTEALQAETLMHDIFYIMYRK